MNKLFAEVKELRGLDRFDSQEVESFAKETFFPHSTIELVKELSTVTSAFYGLFLKVIGEELGKDKIDYYSKRVFYELGMIKAQQASEKLSTLPQDLRVVALTAIGAVYNASPEFSFKITEYSDSKIVLELGGEDRYLRIMQQLGLSAEVARPALFPFLLGIAKFFDVDCDISVENKIVSGCDICDIFTFQAK